MKRTLIRGIIAVCAVFLFRAYLFGAEPVTLDWSSELITSVGSGDFAPYYFTANRQGILTQSANTLLDLRVEKNIDLSRRFSYAFGVEAFGGWSESTAYSQYQAASGWREIERRPAAAMMQQLYGMMKWRGVFLTVGMQAHGSAILNRHLSSGDLIESGNARPLPEARIGFIDFQDIPFTDGWVQIQGEVGYGRFVDTDWLSDHSNYYHSHITHGSLLNYKRCYFRTKPSQPVSVTVGAQCVCVFGGSTYYYINGNLKRIEHHSRDIKDFVEAFLPIHSREDFRFGNSIGSWDMKVRYRMPDNTEISAYFEWPWEDGSGLGRRNGWDGLWGVEYKARSHGWIDGAVAEYIDFTNQSGPLHWSGDDRPGSTLTGHATGADDYYNNAYYNSYANYGMAIGTPFVKSPIFNTDGSMQFLATRMRGFHVAVAGHPGNGWSWRAAASYRKAWGNGKVMMTHPQSDVSVLVEGGYAMPRIKGLELKAAVGIDRGTLLGDNAGVQLTVRYSGSINLKK